jgi:hypothetical protein
MSVLSSTSWFIIDLLIYLLFFVVVRPVVSLIGRKSTTKCNYGAIFNLHTLQFTTARTKSSRSAVFTSCYLVTASNAVDPSTSVFTSSRPRWLSPISRSELSGFQLQNSQITQTHNRFLA